MYLQFIKINLSKFQIRFNTQLLFILVSFFILNSLNLQTLIFQQSTQNKQTINLHI